jgi:hypothetical protein
MPAIATACNPLSYQGDAVMRRTNAMVQIGGTWLAIASALMIAVLVLHGPIAPDLAEQMTRIRGMTIRWAVAHWIAAAGLSLHAVAGLIVLSSQSGRTGGWWTTTAWAVIPIAALWTLTTAVAEATVVANAARFGNREVFEAWWAFAEGKATGFSFLALAMAVIAANDARSAEPATSVWSARTGMVAGVGSFTGWALGMWFGIGLGNILWVLASILVSAWGVWFGVALARSPVGAMPMAEER